MEVKEEQFCSSSIFSLHIKKRRKFGLLTIYNVYIQNLRKKKIQNIIIHQYYLGYYGDVGRDVDFHNIGKYTCQVYTTLKEFHAKYTICVLFGVFNKEGNW